MAEPAALLAAAPAVVPAGMMDVPLESTDTGGISGTLGDRAPSFPEPGASSAPHKKHSLATSAGLQTMVQTRPPKSGACVNACSR